jgi:hypothetical protein
VGLTPSTSYSYRVRAVDAANNQSGLSGAATGSTLDAPPPPTTTPPPPDPTTPPPTTDPAPEVQSVALAASVDEGSSGCPVTVTVTVEATGPMTDVPLSFTVAGVDGSLLITFPPGDLVQVRTLTTTADGTSPGTASATAGTHSDSAGWSACPPPPTTDPPPPTDDGGDGG